MTAQPILTSAVVHHVLGSVRTGGTRSLPAACSTPCACRAAESEAGHDRGPRNDGFRYDSSARDFVPGRPVMDLINILLLIVGGILAISALIVAKKPDAKELIDKLVP